MFRGDTGILIRARNGAVIAYDRTGLILTLSDRSVAELRARLGVADRAAPVAEAPVSARIDPGVLGDIDAWNVVRAGGWYFFDAMLPPYPHPRRFRRAVTGGDILADAPGPVLAMFSLGGARRAGANPGPSAFPAHIVAPGDDIGAVGLYGIEEAAKVDRFQRLTEQTVDALAAAVLLRRRRAAGRALPMVVTRAESDASASVAELAEGRAMGNLLAALDNAVSVAAAMGQGLRLASLALDFAAEDVVSTPEEYVAGMYRLMARVRDAAEARGLRPPVFLIRCDETGARLAEQHQLALFPAGLEVVFTAPGTAFDWTDCARPTEEARRAMAEAEAAALDARLDRGDWACPMLLLAEREGARRIRVICSALKPLVLQGAAHGFAVEGAEVTGVEIAADDDRAVVLTLAGDLSAGPVALTYGRDTRGALRDGWAEDTPDGVLHRWALPARLEVHGC